MIDLTHSSAFPRLAPEVLDQLLKTPEPMSTRQRPLRVYIDTDLDNEIDDFFAIVQLYLAHINVKTGTSSTIPEVKIEGIMAAPFSFRSRLLDMLQAQELTEIPPADRSAPEQKLIDSYYGQISAIEALGDDPQNWLFPETGAPSGDPNAYDHVAIGPDEGMKRSLLAIEGLLKALGATDIPCFAGADSYLENGCPIRCAGVDHLIARARAGSTEDPLYVLGIACATNLASALLLAPDIRDKVVMTWTAGYPTNYTDLVNTSFNLSQDVPAAQVLFSSGVPLVYLPGFYIGQQLTLSEPDIAQWFASKGEIGALLAHRYNNNPLFKWYGIDPDNLTGRVWNIWDMINGAWLLSPGSVASRLVKTPKLSDDRYWIADAQGGPMRENTYTSYNGIFPPFVGALEEYAG